MAMRNASRKQRPKQKRAGTRGGSSSLQFLVRKLARELYQPIVDGPPVDSAIEAEMAASEVLEMLAMADEFPDGGAIRSAVAQELIHRAQARPMPNAVGLLYGLALVAPPELAGRAHAAIEGLEAKGGRRPTWARGQARFVRGWLGGDEYGDREIVVAEFEHPEKQAHALTLLLDPNLGGLLKSVIVSPSADEILNG